MQGRVTLPLFGTVSFGEQMTETNKIIVAVPHLMSMNRTLYRSLSTVRAYFCRAGLLSVGASTAPMKGCGVDLDALQRR